MLTDLLQQALALVSDHNESESDSSCPEHRDDDWIEAVVQGVIASIDDVMGRQLEQVIQADCFKQLEALWRNVQALAGEGYPRGQIRIRLLDMTWQQVSDDLNLSFSLRDASLYRRVCLQEFSTPGGQPFGLLVVDHAITSELDPVSGHDDLFTLQLLGQLGREALCPVLMSIANDFIGTNDPDVWTDPARVRRILASDDFTGWRQLRQQDDTRFVGLTFPALRVRDPWHDYHDQFIFSEQDALFPDSNTLWGNSAFAMARNVLREFCRISWFGFLRSGTTVNNGGALVDLYPSPVTALRLTPELENFYSDNGFIPLGTGYLDGKVGIFSNRSVFQPQAFNGHASDDVVISMLQTTLLACRIGHYLKVQIRDKIGSYKSMGECERELNEWLQAYTSNIEQAEEHILARYPLKRARVRVEGDEKTGRYHCQVSLQPQYQFDFLGASILLRTEMEGNVNKGRVG
ncbi:type VI secretion system contractile sheath domain-containing protein [Endozoicomonadaceae bacterium StTr2]